MRLLFLLLLCSTQSQDPLIRDLEHRDSKVRESAARLLGAHRNMAAIPLLILAVNDPEARVQSAAVDSLRLLTGQEFGTDASKWDQWWEVDGRVKFRQDPEKAEALMDLKLADMDNKVEKVNEQFDKAKSEIRTLTITVAVIGFVFVLVMIFFVGHVSSKLKEWREVVKQTEVYLREGEEITKRTDKIHEELEGKKVDIVSFISKLREENQAELDRYCDLLQEKIEHSIREEVMGLRQKAEKELEQTLGERKTVIDHDIRRVVSEQKERLAEAAGEQQARFARHVDAHTLYLEASFYKAHGKLEEALRLYRKMVASKPDHAVAWADMGTVLREMLRHDEAVESFERALELTPDDSSVCYNLAATYAGMRKRREMLDVLARAFQNDGEFKDEALNDPAFKDYWDDPSFKDIAET